MLSNYIITTTWRVLNPVSHLCLVTLEGATARTDYNHARSAVSRIRADLAGAAVLYIRWSFHLENIRLLSSQTRGSGGPGTCHVLTW